MTDKADTTRKREPRARPKPGKGAPADPEWDKLSQREKFIRTAKELGCDESSKPLDEALRAVGRARKR